MTDLTPTIIPKSDQMNSDDLIGGPRTIRVSKVSLCGDEQPIAINFEGDAGKPYKPCKSMRRVLVQIWGSDGNAYVGRRMTLYRDPSVKFGGLDVGGIRISHMSDIDRDVTMALTASRANRKPFTVKPLAADATPKTMDVLAWERVTLAQISEDDDVARLTAWWNSELMLAERKEAAAVDRAVAGRVRVAFDARCELLTGGV